MEMIFEPSARQPAHERNLIRRMFVNPALREPYENWETIVHAVLARSRAYFAANPDGPRFERLIEDLRRESAEFGEWRQRHDVMGELDGRKRIVHPEVNSLVLEYTTLCSPAALGLRVGTALSLRRWSHSGKRKPSRYSGDFSQTDLIEVVAGILRHLCVSRILTP